MLCLSSFLSPSNAQPGPRELWNLSRIQSLLSFPPLPQPDRQRLPRPPSRFLSLPGPRLLQTGVCTPNPPPTLPFSLHPVEPKSKSDPAALPLYTLCWLPIVLRKKVNLQLWRGIRQPPQPHLTACPSSGSFFQFLWLSGPSVACSWMPSAPGPLHMLTNFHSCDFTCASIIICLISVSFILLDPARQDHLFLLLFTIVPLCLVWYLALNKHLLNKWMKERREGRREEGKEGQTDNTPSSTFVYLVYWNRCSLSH